MKGWTLQIVSVIEDLIGASSIVAMHTMLINKPPDSGESTNFYLF